MVIPCVFIPMHDSIGGIAQCKLSRKCRTKRVKEWRKVLRIYSELKVIDVVLVFLLLTLNIFHKVFLSFIVLLTLNK